jgi:ATP-dependent RNA helicase DHX8/PRP22
MKMGGESSRQNNNGLGNASNQNGVGCRDQSVQGVVGGSRVVDRDVTVGCEKDPHNVTDNLSQQFGNRTWDRLVVGAVGGQNSGAEKRLGSSSKQDGSDSRNNVLLGAVGGQKSVDRDLSTEKRLGCALHVEQATGRRDHLLGAVGGRKSTYSDLKTSAEKRLVPVLKQTGNGTTDHSLNEAVDQKKLLKSILKKWSENGHHSRLYVSVSEQVRLGARDCPEVGAAGGQMLADFDFDMKEKRMQTTNRPYDTRESVDRVLDFESRHCYGRQIKTGDTFKVAEVGAQKPMSRNVKEDDKNGLQDRLGSVKNLAQISMTDHLISVHDEKLVNSHLKKGAENGQGLVSKQDGTGTKGQVAVGAVVGQKSVERGLQTGAEYRLGTVSKYARTGTREHLVVEAVVGQTSVNSDLKTGTRDHSVVGIVDGQKSLQSMLKRDGEIAHQGRLANGSKQAETGRRGHSQFGAVDGPKSLSRELKMETENRQGFKPRSDKTLEQFHFVPAVRRNQKSDTEFSSLGKRVDQQKVDKDSSSRDETAEVMHVVDERATQTRLDSWDRMDNGFDNCFVCDEGQKLEEDARKTSAKDIGCIHQRTAKAWYSSHNLDADQRTVKSEALITFVDEEVHLADLPQQDEGEKVTQGWGDWERGGVGQDSSASLDNQHCVIDLLEDGDIHSTPQDWLDKPGEQLDPKDKGENNSLGSRATLNMPDGVAATPEETPTTQERDNTPEPSVYTGAELNPSEPCSTEDTVAVEKKTGPSDGKEEKGTCAEGGVENPIDLDCPNETSSRTETVVVVPNNHPVDKLCEQTSGHPQQRVKEEVRPAKKANKNSTGSKRKPNIVVVNFDARRLGRRPVKPYLTTQVFKETLKFKMGKMEKKGKVFVARVEMGNREAADCALALLRLSDKNMIISYNIDLSLENCSDLNYDLQMKSLCDLERHDARISEEYKKLQSLIPVEAIILTKKDLQNIMFERRNIEQKLKELTSQREEFVIFMACISHRLLGQGMVGCAEAKLIRQSFGVECCRLKQGLPMYARRGDIVKTVMSRQVTIVLGETGSGKSTQIVQYLYQAGIACDGLIACTQPRKVAAVNLAERVSEEMKSHIGDIVGYKSSTRGKFGVGTKILYMTDYTLLMEFIQDSELSEYNCVVIDEAHERSLYTDILLGMLKKLLLRRKELHVIISSATMDTELFRMYFADFDAQILEVSGRTFPVEVIWPSRNWKGLSKFPVRDAVDKVKEIHRTEESGDVLVFLTTPAETEKGCELLAENKELECMPLHGKLQPQEQQKVFKPLRDGKRKVVFATNCAETSITISGIKYVVDTGLVKENKFDPIRNMSTLDVGKTSKSSVEQRKGRAGRIEAGKCFRLFTKEEYDMMETSNKPEILRVQLGLAILSLMSAGVTSPLQFDFVQSPGTDALEAAMTDIVSIGAVVDGNLTDLGMKISKLQLSPRLGKLVIEGIEQDVAMEAMVVASVCAMSGSMFFRMGNDEEKEKADIRKLPFCHSAGDLLTCLDVYRAWKDIDERQKNKWCFENSINAKAIRIIKETVMELLRTLEREPGIQIDRNFKVDKEDADRKIQKSTFSCFKSHLCLYGGHRRVGYLSCQQGGEQAGALHPSSALTFLDQKPKWLVYDSILKTSQKFILNVTTVEDSWVTEAMESGHLDINLPGIEEKVLVPTRMAEFGYMVMRKLTENKYALCNSLQNQMTKIFGSNVFLDVKMAPCILDIIARKQYHDRVKDIIRDAVKLEKEAIKAREIQQSPNETSTRLVFGNGYNVKLVLGEGEYRSVLVKIEESTYRDITSNEVLDYFEEFGEIKNHFTFKNQTSNKGPRDNAIRWGKITYSSVQEAMAAVENTREEVVFAVPDLQRGKPTKGNRAEYLMKFKYCRRLSKGSGFVRFKGPDDAIRACDSSRSFLVGNSIASLRQNRWDDSLTRVHINNIDVNADEDELKRAVHEALHSHSRSIEEVVLYREKAADSKPKTPAEVDAFKEEMKAAIDEFVTHNKRDQYRIHAQPVQRPGNVYLFGTIFFNALDVFEMVASHLRRGQKCHLGNIPRPFEVTHHITTSFSVPREMYSIIEPCFEEVNSILSTFVEQRMDIKVDANLGNIIRIYLNSEHAKSHKQAIKLYQEIFDGDSISPHSPLMYFVFTAEGEKAMKHIMETSGAYISLDKRMKTMSIYGAEGARTLAKTDLNKFLDEMENNKPKLIRLRDENQPKGLMKKVVQTFGCDLNEVKAIPGITEASFDIRKRLLNVRGNDEALETICQRVKELADEIGRAPPGDDDEIACSVCFDTFEEDYKNMYRLQVCGHAYCLECLQRQVSKVFF